MKRKLNITDPIGTDRRLLLQNYLDLHSKRWISELQCGLNIFLFGLGDKSEILKLFCSKYMESETVILCEGSSSQIKLKGDDDVEDVEEDDGLIESNISTNIRSKQIISNLLDQIFESCIHPTLGSNALLKGKSGSYSSFLCGSADVSSENYCKAILTYLESLCFTAGKRNVGGNSEPGCSIYSVQDEELVLLPSKDMFNEGFEQSHMLLSSQVAPIKRAGEGGSTASTCSDIVSDIESDNEEDTDIVNHISLPEMYSGATVNPLEEFSFASTLIRTTGIFPLSKLQPIPISSESAMLVVPDAWSRIKAVASSKQIFIVVDNIDGEHFQYIDIQRCFSMLAASPLIRFIVTSSHVDCSLLWDNYMSGSYAWVYYHVPTFEPVTSAQNLVKWLRTSKLKSISNDPSTSSKAVDKPELSGGADIVALIQSADCIWKGLSGMHKEILGVLCTWYVDHYTTIFGKDNTNAAEGKDGNDGNEGQPSAAGNKNSLSAKNLKEQKILREKQAKFAAVIDRGLLRSVLYDKCRAKLINLKSMTELNSKLYEFADQNIVKKSTDGDTKVFLSIPKQIIEHYVKLSKAK